VANFTEIDSGIDNLLTTLRKDGFIRAAAKTDRQVDDKEHKVDIVVNITPGPQFIMGKLNIEGLDIQTEPAVRKLWAVKEGKPFNGEYPEFFLKRLREDGIFENLGKTHSEVKLDEQALRADVTLRFGKGTPLQQIGPNADIDQKRR
jgi:outer membrane protein insertion porin family